MNLQEPDLWRRAEELFHRCRDLPASERREHLEAASVPDEVRVLVEELLRVHDQNPETHAAPDRSWAGRRVGTEIGAYRLLDLLGEGSYGAVYLAARTHPPHRQVAVKILKPNVASKEVLARFQGEIQAMALMDHLGIAKFFDSGQTEDDLPYFVMEHVQGQNLRDYRKAHHLNTEQCLRLFLQILDAVQHAHQRGIIHRDLKPSNILVSGDPEQAQVKIIDFGIAKALGQPLTSATLYTQRGQIVGTLNYMSPEQAGRFADRADTTSDIYSLGVILFELLTEKLPYDLSGVPLPEATEIIRTRPPERPSNILRQLRGDLETITLKALEKERGRRYQTVHAFAADIRCFLSQEPISARPPSLPYQLRLYARRHRTKVLIAEVVAAAAVLLLVAGIGFRGRISAAERRLADKGKQAHTLAMAQKVTSLIAQTDKLWYSLTPEVSVYEHWKEEAAGIYDRQEDVAEMVMNLENQALGRLREGDKDWPPGLADAVTLHDMWSLQQQRRREQPYVLGTEQDAIGTDPRREGLIAREEFEEQLGSLSTLRDAFTDPFDSWLHEALVVLLGDLEQLPELYEQVEQRRVEANEVGDRTVRSQEAQARWAEVNSYLAAHQELYPGLISIPAQIGLIPLEPDPESGLYEFLVEFSGEAPQRDSGTGRWQIEEETGLILVLIPGGSFPMGAQNSDPDGPNFWDELFNFERWWINFIDLQDYATVKDVRLEAFLISKHEITRAQWRRMTGDDPSTERKSKRYRNAAAVRLLLPVQNVGWEDCRDALEKWGLCLPTEAQWEYAARGGGEFWPWSFPVSTPPSSEDFVKKGNFCDETIVDGFGYLGGWLVDTGLHDGWEFEAPVGTYDPNPYGLHDMHGNLWEWCQDYLTPYQPGDQFDPRTGLRDVVTPEKTRVFRGGCYQFNSNLARVSMRWGRPPNADYDTVGVRPARLLQRQ